MDKTLPAISGLPEDRLFTTEELSKWLGCETLKTINVNLSKAGVPSIAVKGANRLFYAKHIIQAIELRRNLDDGEADDQGGGD